VFSAQADNNTIFDKLGITAYAYDLAVVGDYVYYVWAQLDIASTAQSLWVTVLNKNTNDVVLSAARIEASTLAKAIKCVTLGSSVYVFSFKSDNTIEGFICDSSSSLFAISGPVSIETSAGFGVIPTAGMSDAFPFDVLTVGSNIAIASKDNSGSKFFRLRVLDAALASVAVGSASAGPSQYTFGISLSYGFTTGKYFFACTMQTSSTAGSAQYSEVTVTGPSAAFSAFTTISALGKLTNIGSVIPTVGRYVVCIEQAFSSIVATDLGNERYHQMLTIDSAAFLVIFKPSACIASKPFMIGSDVRVVVAYDSSTQATFFLIDPTTTSVLSKFFYGDAGGRIPYSLPSVVLNATDTYTLAVAKRLTNNGTSLRQGISAIFLLMNNLDRNWKTASLDESTIIVGSVLSTFDGDVAKEHGFLLSPQISNIATSGGGTLPAGTYQVYTVYEYTDRLGQRYQSAPSNSLSIALNGAQGLIFTADALNFSNDPRYSSTSGVSIVLYMTQANKTTPYRGAALATNPGVVAYTFGPIDSVNSSAEILYTFGGALPNAPTINCSLVGRFKNRVFLGGCDDKNQLFYSKERVSGEPVNFSNDLSVSLPAISGGVTAYQQMDDRFIIFKKDKIFAMAGDGPDDTGANNSFSIPSEIVSPVGCSYPKSVVVFPGGLLFKSEKGIWALDRALNVSYVGGEVEVYNSAKVTSSVLLEQANIVRFTLDSGVRLTYDYLVGQWSVDSGITAVTALNWDGSYTWLKADGGVYKEDPSVYTDNGAAISLTIETAWIKLMDLQGFQRIKRAILLGSYFTAHTVTVSVAYNYGAYERDYVYTPAAVNPEQFEIHLAKQKCESIKFKIVVTFAGSPGRGCNISGLTLLAGMKRGVNKLPVSQKVG
jgi:hypothetical protein